MAQRRRQKKIASTRPWWLEEGAEICPACSHTYVYQTEYRCVACDGSVCSICVETTVEKEIICPGCAKTER